MNWLYQFWFNVVYPSLRGNLPADVVFTVLGTVIGSRLLKGVHAKIDHVIRHHPDIPDFKKGQR